MNLIEIVLQLDTIEGAFKNIIEHCYSFPFITALWKVQGNTVNYLGFISCLHKMCVADNDKWYRCFPCLFKSYCYTY